MSAQPIRIPCPMCQTMLKVPPEAAGKRVKCKSCGHSFQAGITAEQLRPASPPPLPEPVEFDPDEVEAFRLTAGPPTPPAFEMVDRPIPRLAICPDCGAEVSRLADVCPRCGRPFAAGYSKPAGRSWGAASITLLLLGSLLAMSSSCCVCGFGIMDTSVEVPGQFGQRVHNIGLMQERMIGFVAGLVGFVLGLVLVVASFFARSRA